MSKTKSYEWPLAWFPLTSSSHLAWCYFRFCFVLLVWSYNLLQDPSDVLLYRFANLDITLNALHSSWFNISIFGFQGTNLTLKCQFKENTSYSPFDKSVSICRLGLSGLEPPTSRLSGVRSNRLSYKPIWIWQPPALPYRLQYSTIGRLGLNHRVRDENGCVPQAHRHQKFVI